MQLQHKISCLVPAYNESERIRGALEGLAPWADEILVFDKGSSDGTRELATAVSSKVRVIQIPFSQRGCEDFSAMVSLARNEWVYVAVCSEVPTRRLVQAIDAKLAQEGNRVDVVRVPRRIFSLGANSVHSPWSISYYPFLFHRDRVSFAGIHEHFRPSGKDRESQISYAPDVCVYHFTHPSFSSFVDMAKAYAVSEGPNVSYPESQRRLKEGLHTLLSSLCHERAVQNQSIAYAIYSFMVCMKHYEVASEGPWNDHYRAQAREILHREWGVVEACEDDEIQEPSDLTSALSFKCRIYKRLTRGLVSFLVWVSSRQGR